MTARPGDLIAEPRNARRERVVRADPGRSDGYVSWGGAGASMPSGRKRVGAVPG
jgi:hypothetical protein